MELKSKIIEDVYYGKISVEKLPHDLYHFTANKIKAKVDKAFKSSLNDAKKEMLSDLTDNVYMFSAAKTFQNINEMSDALIDEDGNALLLSDYKEVAGGIFDKYNEDWLNVEAITAEVAARTAEQWVDITENNPPALIYVVDEETACDICEPLDAITLPPDDPFWDENATPQHFGCNCFVTEVDQDTFEKIGTSRPDEVEEAWSKSGKDKDPMFNYNAGKDRVIFPDQGKNKHPYFDVPKKFKDFASDNFNLPIPK